MRRRAFALLDCAKLVLIRFHNNCRRTLAGGRGIPTKRTLRVPFDVGPDDQTRNRRSIFHRQQEMQRERLHGDFDMFNGDHTKARIVEEEAFNYFASNVRRTSVGGYVR